MFIIPDPDMIEKERMDIKYLELKKAYKEDSELWVSVNNEVEVSKLFFCVC